MFCFPFTEFDFDSTANLWKMQAENALVMLQDF